MFGREVTISHSTVRDNSSQDSVAGGGGVYAQRLRMSDSIVSGNRIDGPGGGIHAWYADISNSIIRDNVSDSIYAGEGGGGGIQTRHLTLTDSQVTGNSTFGETGRGGGIEIQSTATIVNTTVSGNTTHGESASGGGIHVWSVLNLISSTVSGNSALLSQGGGIYSSNPFVVNGRLSLLNSTISGNSSGSEGGGIRVRGSARIEHSTLTENLASGSVGGGLSIEHDPTVGPAIIVEQYPGRQHGQRSFARPRAPVIRKWISPTV